MKKVSVSYESGVRLDVRKTCPSTGQKKWYTYGFYETEKEALKEAKRLQEKGEVVNVVAWGDAHIPYSKRVKSWEKAVFSK